jgi:hypothetical protein
VCSFKPKSKDRYSPCVRRSVRTPACKGDQITIVELISIYPAPPPVPVTTRRTGKRAGKARDWMVARAWQARLRGVASRMIRRHYQRQSKASTRCAARAGQPGSSRPRHDRYCAGGKLYVRVTAIESQSPLRPLDIFAAFSPPGVPELVQHDRLNSHSLVGRCGQATAISLVFHLGSRIPPKRRNMRLSMRRSLPACG